MSAQVLLLLIALATFADARAQAPASAQAPATVLAPATAPSADTAQMTPDATEESLASPSDGNAARDPAADSSPDEGRTPVTAVSDVDFTHLTSPPQFEWGFNPFLRTPGFAAIDPDNDVLTPDQLELDAIIHDPDEPLAIINGRTVGIGDLVEGLRIETIAANYVLIKGDGQHFELALPPAREAASAAEIIETPRPKEKRP